MKKWMITGLFAMSAALFGAEQAAFVPTEWEGLRRPASNIKKGPEGISVEKNDYLQSSLKQVFKVDPKAVYEVSGDFKILTPNHKEVFFFGVGCMDAKGNHIGSSEVMVYPGTETTVAKDTARGSRTILLTDTSKWPRRSQAHVIGFHVKDGYKDLPNRDFSGNILKVEKTPEGSLITVRYPLGKAYKKGTPVRLHSHASGRNFCAASYRKLNWTGWKTFKGTISTIAPHGAPLNKFWAGTAYGRVVVSIPPGVVFRNVKLVKVNGKVDVVAPPKAAVRNAARPSKSSLMIDSARREGNRLMPKYFKDAEKGLNGPRPRVMLSGAEFESMKKRLKEEKPLQTMFKRLKYVVDLYPETITEESLMRRVVDGRKLIFNTRDKGGPCAMRAAFMYRMTGDKKYAESALKMLRYAADFYNKSYADQKAISWTSFTRISALCAYDWIYDYMSAKERMELGKKLYTHMKQALNTTWIIRSGMQHKGEGTSSWTASFYGTPLLKLYIGIAFHKTGIADAEVLKIFKEGLTDHLRMLSYRAAMSGDFGGGNNSSPGYVFGDAPRCEWYFYTQWKSLTGKNIALDFPNNGKLLHWIHYASIHGIDGKLYEHGTGGGWHFNNRLSINGPYAALYRHFHGNTPVAELADFLISTQNFFKDSHRVALYGADRYDGRVPWMPFQFKYTAPKNYKPNKALFAGMPKSFYFPKLGQTYMYSGREKDSTYAMFTCGAESPAHKQYDENHFVIYKGGFLALDSGTRSASGWKDWLDDMWHDSNYPGRTIAHNAVTIYMKGEKWRGWPKAMYGVANCGGQYKTTGGIVYAYAGNDIYTYVAGDATPCYRSEKAKKVLRQFVFVQPDYFVIHDVVNSVKPDQKKTWHLHSQNEPREQGDIFSWDENQGRLFCRTLLPSDYVRTKVGGPGKEFWVDGKNYPLGKTRLKQYGKKVENYLWGKWRVEISAAAPRTDNEFLHLIQVGLKKDTPSMVKSQLIREKGMTGVKFTAKDGTVWSVLFTKDAKGGAIKAVRNGKVIVNNPLSATIQKQTPFKK